MNFNDPRLEKVVPNFAKQSGVCLDVLRLDAIHPIISGNKWYKLKYYLREAFETKAQTIATFGGAYSNHIVATACAAKLNNINSIGIIRGEAPKQLSHTLQNAVSFGMQLHFVSRENYKNKDSIKQKFQNCFWINEGGFGTEGAKGAAEIADTVSFEDYSHIIVATGTGTTLAGLIKKANKSQKLYGISVMKNNFELINDINSLLTFEERQKGYELLHDYHFGGYAKKNDLLINYINHIYETIGLPLDFVYTGKAFYALQQLIEEKIIPSGSRVLFIHTGGLQGNLSLPKGVLKF